MLRTHPNSAQLFLGGPRDPEQQQKEWHPECVMVFLWDEKEQCYHAKTYSQTNPEKLSDEEILRRRTTE